MKLLKSQIDAGTPREGMDSLTSRNISGGKKEANSNFFNGAFINLILKIIVLHFVGKNILPVIHIYM